MELPTYPHTPTASSRRAARTLITFWREAGATVHEIFGAGTPVT